MPAHLSFIHSRKQGGAHDYVPGNHLCFGLFALPQKGFAHPPGAGAQLENDAEKTRLGIKA
jgi:hypothetical protein